MRRRSERNQETKRIRQKARRAELESRLSGSPSTEEEGVVLFHFDVPREPGAGIGCGGCGAQMSLDPSTPAAICRCGTLYYGETKGVAGRIEFSVESLPADAD
jgi:hypothetical protein